METLQPIPQPRGITGCLVAFGAVFAGFAVLWMALAGGAAVLFGWQGGVAGGLAGGAMALFGLPFLALGLLMTWLGLRGPMARKRLRVAGMEASASRLRMGDPLSWRVTVAALQETPATSVTVRVLCREWAHWSAGTDSRTYVEDVFKEEKIFPIDGPVRPDAAVTFEGETRIPDSGPVSFKASNNKVTWSVMIVVDIPKWPDLEDTYEITVLPVRARARVGGA